MTSLLVNAAAAICPVSASTARHGQLYGPWSSLYAEHGAIMPREPRRGPSPRQDVRAGGGASDHRAIGNAAGRYYPYRSRRRAFLLKLGRREEARIACDRAVALAGSAAEAGQIRRHLDRLMHVGETDNKTPCSPVGIGQG